jgi:hypothetical protein
MISKDLCMYSAHDPREPGQKISQFESVSIWELGPESGKNVDEAEHVIRTGAERTFPPPREGGALLLRHRGHEWVFESGH